MEKITMSKSAIYKNFAQRLSTQDRFYASVCYPVSLLKRILTNHGESDFYTALTNGQIDRIIAYVGPDKTKSIKISQVESLTINSNGSVQLLTSDAKQHTLYSMDSKEKSLQSVVVEKLGNIHIDHVVPMLKVLKKLDADLPMLKKMRQNLLLIDNREELQSWGEFLFDINSVTKEDLQQLKREITLIDQNIKLQLMYSKSNLSKSKK